MAPPERDRSLYDELGIAADVEQLRRLEPPVESSARRDQVLRSVLQQADAHPAAPAALRWREPVLSIAALAAAALCAMWISAERPSKHAPRAAAGEQADELAAELAPQLATGRLVAGNESLAVGARITAGRTLRTAAEPAQLVLGDRSELLAAASTTLVYAGAATAAEREERFRLEQGRVSLQVNARARRNPLVIETAELTVWVVGTRFEVTREQGARPGTTVRVSEGVVRVVAKADAQEHRLEAGQHITLYRAGHPVGASEQASQPAPGSAVDPVPAPSSSTRTPALAGAAAQRGEARPQHALSVEIRRQLRAGSVGVARRMIQRAERERSVAAVELALLQAEADLAEHRYGRAKSRYLAIVAQHAGSPEAELSLFAAAQLSRGQAGIDLLQRYLARYPDGRFAKEAHRLLQALELPDGAR